MIKLDDDLLNELGLAALPAEEKKKFLAHLYETLEMRVGMKLAEQMSDAQLREFEQFIDANNEAGALKWLETNFPNYKDVVASEFEKLKGEVRQLAPQILAASLGAGAPAGQPQPDPAMQQQVVAPNQGQPQPTQGYPQPMQPPAQPMPQQPYPGQQQPMPPQPQYPQPPMPGQPGVPPQTPAQY